MCHVYTSFPRQWILENGKYGQYGDYFCKYVITIRVRLVFGMFRDLILKILNATFATKTLPHKNEFQIYFQVRILYRKINIQ